MHFIYISLVLNDGSEKKFNLKNENLQNRKFKIDGNLLTLEELIVEAENLKRRLQIVVQENLEAMNKQKQLKVKLLKINEKNDNGHHKNSEPSLKYEQLRRRIGSNIRSYINFMLYEIGHMEYTLKLNFTKNPTFHQLIREYKM
jgi:hypothetical protein